MEIGNIIGSAMTYLQHNWPPTTWKLTPTDYYFGKRDEIVKFVSKFSGRLLKVGVKNSFVVINNSFGLRKFQNYPPTLFPIIYFYLCIYQSIKQLLFNHVKYPNRFIITTWQSNIGSCTLIAIKIIGNKSVKSPFSFQSSEISDHYLAIDQFRALMIPMVSNRSQQ